MFSGEFPGRQVAVGVLAGALLCACTAQPRLPPAPAAAGEETTRALRAEVGTIVVIYAENRSFDNLYGHFPGANGLDQAANAAPQRDRDGTVLAELPPVWDGLTAKGVTILKRDDSDPNGRFAWIVDPDGTKIELWQSKAP